MTNYSYLLFNQSPQQLRQLGARGGRATARNRRLSLLTQAQPKHRGRQSRLRFWKPRPKPSPLSMRGFRGCGERRSARSHDGRSNRLQPTVAADALWNPGRDCSLRRTALVIGRRSAPPVIPLLAVGRHCPTDAAGRSIPRTCSGRSKEPTPSPATMIAARARPQRDKPAAHCQVDRLARAAAPVW